MAAAEERLRRFQLPKDGPHASDPALRTALLVETWAIEELILASTSVAQSVCSLRHHGCFQTQVQEDLGKLTRGKSYEG